MSVWQPLGNAERVLESRWEILLLARYNEKSEKWSHQPIGGKADCTAAIGKRCQFSSSFSEAPCFCLNVLIQILKTLSGSSPNFALSYYTTVPLRGLFCHSRLYGTYELRTYVHIYFGFKQIFSLTCRDNPCIARLKISFCMQIYSIDRSQAPVFTGHYSRIHMFTQTYIKIL